MKKTAQGMGRVPEISESDARMVSHIREITARGNNVEIRRKGEGYSILEVRKKCSVDQTAGGQRFIWGNGQFSLFFPPH